MTLLKTKINSCEVLKCEEEISSEEFFRPTEYFTEKVIMDKETYNPNPDSKGDELVTNCTFQLGKQIKSEIGAEDFDTKDTDDSQEVFNCSGEYILGLPSPQSPCKTTEPKSFNEQDEDTTLKNVTTNEKSSEWNECVKPNQLYLIGERSPTSNDYPKDFVSLNDLKKHKRLLTVKKLFICKICGKCFSRPDHLKSHEIIHTGEKAFECSICGTRLARSGDLERHVQRHKEGTPFECNICGRRFKRYSGYKNHEKTHVAKK